VAGWIWSPDYWHLFNLDLDLITYHYTVRAYQIIPCDVYVQLNVSWKCWNIMEMSEKNSRNRLQGGSDGHTHDSIYTSRLFRVCWKWSYYYKYKIFHIRFILCYLVSSLCFSLLYTRVCRIFCIVSELFSHLKVSFLAFYEHELFFTW